MIIPRHTYISTLRYSPIIIWGSSHPTVWHANPRTDQPLRCDLAGRVLMLIGSFVFTQFFLFFLFQNKMHQPSLNLLSPTLASFFAAALTCISSILVSIMQLTAGIRQCQINDRYCIPHKKVWLIDCEMARGEHIISVNKTFVAWMTVTSAKYFIRSKDTSLAKERIMEWGLAMFASQFFTQLIILWSLAMAGALCLEWK